MMTDWHRMPVDCGRRRPWSRLSRSARNRLAGPGRQGVVRRDSKSTRRIQRDLATPAAAAATFPGGDRDRGSPASDSGADGD
jgi:hypothetical protein